MNLVGAKPGKAVASGLDKQPGIVNYFIGNDPKQWRTNIPTYARAKLTGVYPGIDVVYYGQEARGKGQEARGKSQEAGGKGQEEKAGAARPGPTMNRRSATRIPPSRDGGQPTKVGFVSQPGDSSPGHGGALSDCGISDLKSQISDRGLSALSSQLSALEYDFIVHPGADPSRIHLAFEGAEKVRVANGDLILTTPAGDVRMKRPYAYQTIGGKRVQVACDYRLLSPLASRPSPRIAFRLAKYDTTRPLVVDPVLVFATYIGGSGDDRPRSIAVDSAGCAYVAGYTDASNYPTTWRSFAGQWDGFVTKLNAAGTAIVYSTYFGGGGDDSVLAVAVDAAGSAYVTGDTGSSLPCTSGAYDTTHNGDFDGFIAKINPAGNGLSYCTYLGGAAYDQGRRIAVDAAGAIYITGMTSSANFPVTSGVYDAAFNGDTDVYVAKIRPDGAGVSDLVYSTFVHADSWAWSDGGIKVDDAGCTYVTGRTSSNFTTTLGAFQTTHGGGSDGFILKLNPTGTGALYATYIGGSSGEVFYNLTLDPSGAVYVCGETDSTNFPTSVGAYDTIHNGSADAFVTKLNADGTALEYSTFLGGSGYDAAYQVGLLSAGTVCVTGSTTSSNFPTAGGAYDTSHNGSEDVFVAKLSADCSALTYSTFFGGTGEDWGTAIATDGSRYAWVAGQTGSGMPIMSYAYDTSHNGSSDAWVAKMDFRGRMLWAWGDNMYGQLGLGTTSNRYVPTQVPIGDVVALSCGAYHALAICSDGVLYSWGQNEEGKLGYVGPDRTDPTPVNLQSPVAVSAGRHHNLAITDGGHLFSWGGNEYNQLGYGGPNRNYPEEVPGIQNVVAVATGGVHSLAVTADGSLYSWGNNDYGQLGYPGGHQSHPTLVPLSNVVSVAAGMYFSMAITSDRRIYTWGRNNRGQLGIGHFNNTSTPTLVSLWNVTQISAGYEFALAVTTGGYAYSWGYNSEGQLGRYTSGWSQTDRASPSNVWNIWGVKSVSAGEAHAVALLYNGNAYSWGRGTEGQLGLDTSPNEPLPVLITRLANVRTISTGWRFSMAITSDNAIPIANPQTVSATSGVGKPITLTGSDGDGDSLTYSIVTDPTNGNVTGTAPSFTYTSAATFHGTDTFTFKVNDGYDDSAPATVTVNVDAPAPVALNLSPSSAGPGSDVELAVRGTGFCSDSVVRWNGTDLTRVSVTAKLIRATVPAALLATPGGATVTVYTPGPGGGESNGLIFRIGQPAIKVDALTVSKNGTLSARITLKNTGAGIAQNVRITLAKMQKLPGGPVVTTSTSLPVVVGNLNPGATIVVTPDLQWPGTVANTGDTVLVQLGGTFTGGAFSSSRKATVVGGKAGRK